MYVLFPQFVQKQPIYIFHPSLDSYKEWI